jgi:hypothetical protein
MPWKERYVMDERLQFVARLKLALNRLPNLVQGTR